MRAKNSNTSGELILMCAQGDGAQAQLPSWLEGSVVLHEDFLSRPLTVFFERRASPHIVKKEASAINDDQTKSQAGAVAPIQHPRKTRHLPAACFHPPCMNE
jgi:hypothetical protein